MFELEEDESAALVGGAERPAAAQRVPDRPDAQESMPLWVIPLLVAAVRRGLNVTTDCCRVAVRRTRRLMAGPRHLMRVHTAGKLSSMADDQYWIMQVFAVSSAGAVFKLMGKVPPLSLAAWRLQLTTLLLLPGCIINFRSLSPGARSGAHMGVVSKLSKQYLAARRM